MVVDETRKSKPISIIPLWSLHWVLLQCPALISFLDFLRQWAVMYKMKCVLSSPNLIFSVFHHSHREAN